METLVYIKQAKKFWVGIGGGDSRIKYNGGLDC